MDITEKLDLFAKSFVFRFSRTCERVFWARFVVFAAVQLRFTFTKATSINPVAPSFTIFTPLARNITLGREILATATDFTILRVAVARLTLVEAHFPESSWDFSLLAFPIAFLAVRSRFGQISIFLKVLKGVTKIRKAQTRITHRLKARLCPCRNFLCIFVIIWSSNFMSLILLLLNIAPWKDFSKALTVCFYIGVLIFGGRSWSSENYLKLVTWVLMHSKFAAGILWREGSLACLLTGKIQKCGSIANYAIRHRLIFCIDECRGISVASANIQRLLSNVLVLDNDHVSLNLRHFLDLFLVEKLLYSTWAKVTILSWNWPIALQAFKTYTKDLYQ